VSDITDPQAIRWVNEVIRPRAEQFRALRARIDADMTTWYSQISTLVPNDSSPVADGRENEGVSRLLGSDVVNLVTQMAAFQTACNVSGVADVISKPCVRNIEQTL
jgi:hypothetical protein